MRKIAVLLLTAALLSLCACQPTPEESVVVSKQESLADVAEETEENQLADIPSSIQEDRIDLTDRLTVVMDAQITVPQEGKLSVARLTRLGVDQEMGERWLNALADGRTIYYERTLADLSVQELTEAIDVISSTGEYPVHLYHMDGLDVSGKDAAISCLQGYLENAPAEPNYRYFTSGDPVLNRTLEFDGAPDFAVCLANIADGQRALLYSCYNSQAPDGVVIGLDQQEAFGVTISVDEATAQAEALLEQMGLDDFTLDAAGWIPYLDLYDDAYTSYQELPKCYALYFTKQIGGMNETYVGPTYVRVANREESYNDVWEPEIVVVTVADEGILSVEITEYPSQVEILSENVEILPFDDILERFYEQIKVSGCWVDESREDSIEKRTVYIDEIVLGGMRTIEKDASTYLYVPVWSFFGQVVTQYKEGEEDPNQVNENNEYTHVDYRQCVLTISAIDGRVIDRALGY